MTTPPPPPPPIPDMMAISVASRIPEFWTDQPRVWFIRTEATLAPQKLGDHSKFDIVVSKLSKEVIAQLSDFLSKPPETEKFKAIKEKLLTLFEDSKTRQIEKLIGEMDLGEQKPSQLLHRMKDLARDKIPDDTLRVLWQGHLPSTVRAVLSVSDTKDLDKLASIADNVTDATRPAHVSSISNQNQQQSTSDTALIMAEIAKLSVRLMDLERGRPRNRTFGRGRNFSTSRSRTRSSSFRRRTPESPNWLCVYHHRFRARAKKCEQPCAWKPQRNEKPNSEN